MIYYRGSSLTTDQGCAVGVVGTEPFWVRGVGVRIRPFEDAGVVRVGLSEIEESDSDFFPFKLM